MDANQTRFQLIYGKQDWLGPAASQGSPPALAVEWNDSTSTIALAQKVFLFPVAQPASVLSISARRAAAQDRFGNHYWIADSQTEILFLGANQRTAEHFWSGQDLNTPCPQSSQGLFSPAAPLSPRVLMFSGAAVTTDHYLVVGLLDPAGLLIFDLYSGGPPLEFHWPSNIAFSPFDIAAAPGGGVWILDRSNRRYWGLDAYFRIVFPQPQASQPPRLEDFQPLTGSLTYASDCQSTESIDISLAMPVTAVNPVSIESLPDGSVLLLDNPPLLNHSRIFRYRLSVQLGSAVDLDQLDIGDGQSYALLGQDFAFVPDSSTTVNGSVAGTLYVADSHGDQTFTFAYTTTDAGWAAEPDPQFFPMLRFGGKALVSSSASVSYDFDDRWAPLVAQPRQRFDTQATWVLPQPASDGSPQAFDGKQPGVIWHRLFVDGSIPLGTQVIVQTRASDSRDLLASTSWQTEPQLYLRDGGSELPYYSPALPCSGGRSGTWELLFQNARGRYLEVSLTLLGNGRSTPRLQALRAYYRRFSYLREYLPAVYQDDATSASFLERYLANPEGFFTGLEDRIQQVQELFDPRTAPEEYLVWLAGWLGISFDFTWSEAVRRFFLENAPRFFNSRGTVDGVTRMIRLALDQCTDVSLFEPADQQHFSVRIVENYLKRKAPGVVFGDPNDTFGPGSTSAELSWSPAQGPQPINQCYRKFLKTQYADVLALNNAWSTSFTSFDDPTLVLPGIQPLQSAQASDWATFLQVDLGFTYAIVTAADEPAFTDFLMRRYAQVLDLNTAYGLSGAAALSSFVEIHDKLWVAQFSSALPSGGTILRDWILFVSVVLPTLRNAHLFTVVVPVQLTDSPDTQLARRNLATRIAAQEKPAHTDFEVKLYWAMFQVGEARVGLESVVGPSSRFAALVLGSNSLAESYLGFTEPWNVRGRIVAGRDQLKAPRNSCGGSRK
jgi:phage tail-like protein